MPRRLQSIRPRTRARTAAFTLVELLIVIAIIGILASLLIPAVQSSRLNAQRLSCANKLRQLNIGMQSYDASHRRLPSGAVMQTYTPEPKLAPTFFRWSALAQITPFLELDSLHSSIDFSLPLYVGDNPLSVTLRPAHAEIVKLVLPEFLCPSDIGEAVEPEWGPTNYVVCAGSGVKGGTPLSTDGTFFARSETKFSNMTDGTGKTVLLSESLLGQSRATDHDAQTEYKFTLALTLSDSACDIAKQWNYQDLRGFAWASGEYRCALYNHYLTPNSSTPDCMGAMIGGEARYSALGWRAARSRHPRGVNIGLADGGVRFIEENINATVWRALSTIAASDTADLP